MNGTLRERTKHELRRQRVQRFAPHAFAALLRGWQLRNRVGDYARERVQSGADGDGDELAATASTRRMAEEQSATSTSTATQSGFDGGM